MAKEKMALCYSITVVASAFLLAQYAKYILMNGMGKGSTMILLMMTVMLPAAAELVLRRGSLEQVRGLTDGTFHGIAASGVVAGKKIFLKNAASAVCIVLGNATWYVLLLKTTKLLWNTPPAVWGISFVFVVSAAVMYTGRRAIFL